jgi:hypothetical protein
MNVKSILLDISTSNIVKTKHYYMQMYTGREKWMETLTEIFHNFA